MQTIEIHDRLCQPDPECWKVPSGFSLPTPRLAHSRALPSASPGALTCSAAHKFCNPSPATSAWHPIICCLALHPRFLKINNFVIKDGEKIINSNQWRTLCLRGIQRKYAPTATSHQWHAVRPSP